MGACPLSRRLWLFCRQFALLPELKHDMGSLTGNVTDNSGALVPKATIEILNMATGFKTQATTDDNGAYLVSNPARLVSSYYLRSVFPNTHSGRLWKCRRPDAVDNAA